MATAYTSRRHGVYLHENSPTPGTRRGNYRNHKLLGVEEKKRKKKESRVADSYIDKYCRFKNG